DREAAQKAAARELRDRALAYLRSGRDAADSPALVEGLIAFADSRFDDALARLDEAFRAQPSLYEAQRIAGDVHTRLAHDAVARGDTNAAHASGAKAAEAYRSAAAIARSDEAIEVGECGRRYELMLLDWNHGKLSEGTVDEALLGC